VSSRRLVRDGQTRANERTKHEPPSGYHGNLRAFRVLGEDRVDPKQGNEQGEGQEGIRYDEPSRNFFHVFVVTAEQLHES